MRYTAVAIAGLAAVVRATVPFDPIFVPADGQEVPVCAPITITWEAQPSTYDDQTVKIGLIGGQTQGTQVPLYDIATGVVNSAGKFVWTPKADEFGKPFYGITIYLESDLSVMQYSNPFKVVAGNCGTSSSSSSDSSTSTGSSTAASTTSSVSVVTVASVSTTPCTETHTTPTTMSTVTPPCNSTAPVTYPWTTITQTGTWTAPANNYPTPPPVATSSPLPVGAASGRGFSLVVLGGAALAALAL